MKTPQPFLMETANTFTFALYPEDAVPLYFGNYCRLEKTREMEAWERRSSWISIAVRVATVRFSDCKKMNR